MLLTHGVLAVEVQLSVCIINLRKPENDRDHDQHKYCQKLKCAKEKAFNIYFSRPRHRALEPFAGHEGEEAMRLPLGMACAMR